MSIAIIAEIKFVIKNAVRAYCIVFLVNDNVINIGKNKSSASF